MLHYIKKSYISGQSAKLYLYSAHEKPTKYAKEVEAILKRISVKFQQQEQIYRSLHAAARSLLSSKGRVFLLFLLFYKVLTNFLFVPALQLIWALTLRFAPIRYLNNKTASRIFASPAIIVCIAVLAVLVAFWSLYEIAAMLQLLTRMRHGEPLRVGAVFRDAFCSLVRVFLPQNLPLLLYGVALIPLTNFFLAANHLTQFAVPEYLWGLLKARAANRFLFALAVLCVLALLLDADRCRAHRTDAAVRGFAVLLCHSWCRLCQHCCPAGAFSRGTADRTAVPLSAHGLRHDGGAKHPYRGTV